MKCGKIKWIENKMQYSYGEYGYVNGLNLFYLDKYDLHGKITLSTELPIKEYTKNFDRPERARLYANLMVLGFVKKLMEVE